MTIVDDLLYYRQTLLNQRHPDLRPLVQIITAILVRSGFKKAAQTELGTPKDRSRGFWVRVDVHDDEFCICVGDSGASLRSEIIAGGIYYRTIYGVFSRALGGKIAQAHITTVRPNDFWMLRVLPLPNDLLQLVRKVVDES